MMMITIIVMTMVLREKKKDKKLIQITQFSTMEDHGKHVKNIVSDNSCIQRIN